MNASKHRLLSAVCLLAALSGAAANLNETPLIVQETRTTHGARLVYRFSVPETLRTVNGYAVNLTGCDADEQAGAPVLPICGVNIAVPPGKCVTRVRITPLETIEIALDGPVRCGEYALPLSADPRQLARARPNRSIYNSNRPFPAHDTPLFRVDRQHGRDSLALTLQPIQVIPSENRLLTHRVLAVDLTWGDARVTTVGPAAASPLLQGPATEAKLPAGTNAYVIIGDADLLANTPPPWNFAALLDSRRMAGLTATNVSVTWIMATYTGNDTPTKIRAFIRDAYQTWGTRFVLLAGTQALIPARQLYCAFSSYTAYIPSDSLYYGCLDGDFNYDGDALYGEPHDGVNGGDVDLLAEVAVGRFPIDSTNEAAQVIRKTLLYEAAPTSSLSRVTHVGEYLNFGGPADYATGMMEEIRVGSTDADYTTLGFENPTYGAFFDTSDTLYDAPTYTWPAEQIINRLNSDFHVINHMGHGAAWICFKLNLYLTADKLAIANLTNNVNYLVYSQACDTGRFDDYPDCFAEQLVTTRAGAFAAVMNTRYGWGYQNSVDGPSQRFHRRFWDAVFAKGKYHLGTMNQDAKERNRYLVNPTTGDPMRWCYYEITLFGDPATPFAARILNFAPTFTHTPLDNQFAAESAYKIDCLIGPVSLCQPGSPQLIWQSSHAPGTIHTNPMNPSAGGRYEASIPAQPTGTRISYHLCAATLAGITGQWPDSGDLTFVVTDPFSLTVQGQPAPYGVVTPAYGVSLIASGTVVSATAPASVDITTGVRQASAGWLGSGSVPATGSSNQVAFTLHASSKLYWQWTTEFALLQQSSVADLFSSNRWYRAGILADSMIAPDSITKNDKNYTFCGWYLDGIRQPVAPGQIMNPATGIQMSTNRLLYALYLTTTMDLDGNRLPDWWEYNFFGTNGVSATADLDGDGFNTEAEYLDRTDPLDPASYPAPPVIMHVPLTSPQRVPPPYTISATLTDSCAIASATLDWRRNGGTWQSTAFSSQSTGFYTGTIPAPGEPADTFDYRLVAVDPVGQAATSSIYTVFLQYPRLMVGPSQGRDLVLRPTGVDYATLALTNTGNGRLNWTLTRGLHEVVSPGMTDWRTNAYGQIWQLSTARSFSPPYAFFAHLTSGGLQVATPAVHACLDSPVIQLAPNARLFFRHWAKTELDTLEGYCFDGGIVEISTNAGASFIQLPGPYTHRIHGWIYSPWPQDTPCFAGNGTSGWTESTFDLTAYAGKSIMLRFHYGADNNTDDEGWYVDDIRVGPLAIPGWPDWAVCGAMAGSLVGGARMVFPFDTDASLSALRDDRLAIHVMSNDPITPNIYLDWNLKIRDAPALSALRAWQSSTNGEGLVSLCFNVSDPDGEAVDLQVDSSIDNGATWTTPLLNGTTVTVGQPPEGTVTGRFTHLATADASGLRSNTVNTIWPTQTPAPGITMATAAYLRVQAANPYFTSEYRISPPFFIDNQPPSTANAHAWITTSDTGNYVVGTNVLFAWDGFEDLLSGIAGYRVRNLAAPLVLSTSTNSLLMAAQPTGVTNGFTVAAIDHVGNLSTGLNVFVLILDPLADPDGDGMLSRDEEIAGTDALSDAQRFTTSLDANSDTLIIQWTGRTGRIYTIERTPGILPAAWSPLTAFTGIPGSNGLMRATVPQEANTGFFRIHVSR